MIDPDAEDTGISLAQSLTAGAGGSLKAAAALPKALPTEGQPLTVGDKIANLGIEAGQIAEPYLTAPNLDMSLPDIGKQALKYSTGLSTIQAPQLAEDIKKAAKTEQDAIAASEAAQKANYDELQKQRVASMLGSFERAGFEPEETQREIEEEGLTVSLADVQDYFNKVRQFVAKGGRIGFATGTGNEDDRDEIAFNLFGKPYVELDLDEREELKEEMIGLRNKFMATGGRVGMQPGGLAGLAKMLMSIMRKGDEKQIKGVIRDPKTDLERLKDTDPKQPTIRAMEDLPGKLGYDKRNTRKLEELVEREKVRAILADRMGVDPKEISEVDIDMAIREGMGMFSKGGGVGSLFRRK